METSQTHLKISLEHTDNLTACHGTFPISRWFRCKAWSSGKNEPFLDPTGTLPPFFAGPGARGSGYVHLTESGDGSQRRPAGRDLWDPRATAGSGWLLHQDVRRDLLKQGEWSDLHMMLMGSWWDVVGLGEFRSAGCFCMLVWFDDVSFYDDAHWFLRSLSQAFQQPRYQNHSLMLPSERYKEHLQLGLSPWFLIIYHQLQKQSCHSSSNMVFFKIWAHHCCYAWLGKQTWIAMLFKQAVHPCCPALVPGSIFGYPGVYFWWKILVMVADAVVFRQTRVSLWVLDPKNLIGLVTLVGNGGMTQKNEWQPSITFPFRNQPTSNEP